MRVIKPTLPAGRFLHLETGAPVPLEGDITVPFQMWVTDMESLSWREGRIGVRINTVARFNETIPGLSRLAAIVIEPVATQADVDQLVAQVRRLRSLEGFRGTLIARGPLLEHEIGPLYAAGIDAFEAARPSVRTPPSGHRAPCLRLSA